jgi:hypothetical protein
MQAIKPERPEHVVLIHTAAGALLAAIGRLHEAESEYLIVFSTLEQSGKNRTIEMAGILYSLGVLYIRSHRFDDVQRVVERAIDICSTAPDAVPMDWIRLLGVRAAVQIHRRGWSDAEHTLRRAISMAEGEARLDSVILATLLDDYAGVLRRRRASAKPAP